MQAVPRVEHAAAETLLLPFVMGEVDAALVLQIDLQMLGNDRSQKLPGRLGVERRRVDLVQDRCDPQHGW